MTRGNETFAEMGLGKKGKEIASYRVPVTGDMKIHRDFNELREQSGSRNTHYTTAEVITYIAKYAVLPACLYTMFT